MHSRRWIVSAVFVLFCQAMGALTLGGQEPPDSAAKSRPNARSPLGINLAALGEGATEVPFVNLFQLTQPWVLKRELTDKVSQPELDAKGWVRRLEPGQFAETSLYAPNARPAAAGTYTCRYEGDGLIDFASGARTLSRDKGRVMLQVMPGKGPIVVRLLKTNPADPVRNIQLLPPGFDNEDTLKKIPLFHPRFLEHWNKFKVVRFTAWQRTNNSKLVEWADRTTPEHATQAGNNGVCLEHMIDLANTLGADPWFCMPHRASDDFVRRFARLVKDKLDPQLKVYVEYSNECWNGQYEQGKYCNDEGEKRRLADLPLEGQLRFYSERSLEIFQLWQQEFGRGKRLVRVLAAQCLNTWAGSGIVEWKQAWMHADAIAVAPYFGSEFGAPAATAKVTDWSVEELLAGCQKSIQKKLEWTRLYSMLAQKYGLQLLAYEGGQRLVGYRGAENNEVLQKLFREANRHPKMKDVYLEDLAAWKKFGGGLYCATTSMSAPSKSGSFGLLEYPDDNVRQAPKYQALLEFIAWNPVR